MGSKAGGILRGACLVGLLGLSACGGSSGGSPSAESATGAPTGADAPATGTGAAPTAGTGTALSAGPGCTLQYTLTGSPLLAGADPLLARQWHLANTGQTGGTAGEDLRAVAAWAVTRGEGVRIAVIDDAVEVMHADLRANVADGQSFSYRAGQRGSAYPVPCTVDDSHGTAVAGIAAARDGNAIGGAGVAPRASLVGYDALSSSTDGDVADALARAPDANHVYHNSWGAPDDRALHRADPAFDAAIDAGLARGRGGLGSVYVFSAGNGGCDDRRRASGACFDDDSNYDGYVNRRGVIAVCAVDDAGGRPDYGEPGANLAVCAPSAGARLASGITTTALRDGFRSDFDGTSASAPMVSGVVALMLAVNPQLTWRDVPQILARTARHNDPGDPDWTSAFGLRFNHKYGFGVVDAEAAVAAARGWTSVGGSAAQKTCGPYASSVGRELRDPLPNGAPQPVADTVVVAGCAITRIEWVELRFTAPHTYPGDLRVRLRSPNGLVSRLADARSCRGGCGSYDGWRFGSMRHLDEPAEGGWTLEATDLVADDTGTFAGWSLTLHGR
jgi:proprotein convertase subtilisin/kexin type 2